MDGHHRGMGVCGDGGSVHGGSLRKQRCAPESGGDAGVCGASGIVREMPALYYGAASWGHCRCNAGLVALHPSLEETPHQGPEPCMFLNAASDTKYRTEPI